MDSSGLQESEKPDSCERAVASQGRHACERLKALTPDDFEETADVVYVVGLKKCVHEH